MQGGGGDSGRDLLVSWEINWKTVFFITSSHWKNVKFESEEVAYQFCEKWHSCFYHVLILCCPYSWVMALVLNFGKIFELVLFLSLSLFHGFFIYRLCIMPLFVNSILKITFIWTFIFFKTCMIERLMNWSPFCLFNWLYPSFIRSGFKNLGPSFLKSVLTGKSYSQFLIHSHNTDRYLL